MRPPLWDTHVHLDFMREPRLVAQEAQELGLNLFGVTVTPQGFETATEELADAPNVRVGIGLHPWWVADGRCAAADVADAAAQARVARYVGEIGLDLAPRHVPEGSLETQLAAFEAVVGACADTSDPAAPKVLSIHSVRAAGLTLDALDRTGCLGACLCIFHWFSGTSDELHRVVQTGCLVSVNEMMLRTRRGREYARQLPADRLLLETDLPPGENVVFTAREIQAQLERTVQQLAQIRGTDAETLAKLTSTNAARLFG